MIKLIGFAIYLGIGAMLYALFVGNHFDWTSAWTFGWLFGWPIMLVISSMVVLVGLIIAIIAIVLILMFADSIGTWNMRRHLKKIRMKRNG